MKDIVKAFKALSDETRLRIFNLLRERECCVCEVMQALDISQSRASRNLVYLYGAGLLKLRKEGPWALYSIDIERTAGYIQTLIEAIALALEHNGQAATDRERLRKAKRIGPGCCENACHEANTAS